MTAAQPLSFSQGQSDHPTFSVTDLIEELRHTASGISTGWKALDGLGVRLRAKELALLAARTGHGKTSALVNLTMAQLEDDSDGMILYYSHEEPPEHILCRLLALLALKPIEPWTVAEIREYLSTTHTWAKEHNESDIALLNSAVQRLSGLEQRILVVHKPDWTAAKIADHARSVSMTRRVSLVLIDYLQRIPVSPTLHARDQEVALTGRTLKSLAVDIAAPVAAGVQVNRDVIPQGYQDKVRKAASGSVADAIEVMKSARPDLNYLREGGSEQEADLILGLMNYSADLRTEASNNHARTDLFEIGVLKNRYGPTGQWAPFSYSGSSGRIADIRNTDESEAL